MSEVTPLDPSEVITATGERTVEATPEGKFQLRCPEPVRGGDVINDVRGRAVCSWS